MAIEKGRKREPGKGGAVELSEQELKAAQGGQLGPVKPLSWKMSSLDGKANDVMTEE